MLRKPWRAFKLEAIFDAPVGTPESDEADMIGLMVDEYEKKHYPINCWYDSQIEQATESFTRTFD